jgi:hypothetical protein
MDHPTRRTIALIKFDFRIDRTQLGSVMGGGKNRSFVIITQRHAASHWATLDH